MSELITTRLTRSRRSGCETSLPAVTSRKVTLTSGQSSMFDLLTWRDTSSAISSPESADGRAPSTSPDGQPAGKFGLAPVLASLSARSTSAAAERMTTNTSGQNSCALSRSADLQSFLESRLQEGLDLNGSPEFALIWKQQAMPWGAPIFRLAASQRHRNASETGLLPWATPKASDGDKASALSKARQAQGRHSDNLPAQVREFCGQTLKQRGGTTASAGALSPEHSCLVMGYQIAWLRCAALEMQLSQPSRRTSSVPSCKEAG